MAKLVLLLALALASVILAESIRLHRVSDQFTPYEELPWHMQRLQYGQRLDGARTAIPLDGGLLTIGTYIAKITVGTPAVAFYMLMDTGSSNLALPTVGCSSCDVSSQYMFDPSGSSTWADMDCNSAICQKCYPTNVLSATTNSSTSCTDCSNFFGDAVCYPTGQCGFGITYGGGSTALQGYYGTDVVCLGSYCVTSTVGLITAENPPGNMNTFNSNSTDPTSVGILGLASEFNACNPSCVLPYLDDLVLDNQVSNVFGICIDYTDGGVLDLGTLDSSKYSGELTYIPMTFDRWYNIALLEIQIGGVSIGDISVLFGVSNDVIGSFVDTGTSIILMNPGSWYYFESTFRTNYPSLPGLEALFTEGCTLAHNIPDITVYPDVEFVFQGYNNTTQTFSVPPKAYLLNSEGFYCLGFGGTFSGIGVVLGDVFMTNYYIAFDRENQQLGFAPVTTCV